MEISKQTLREAFPEIAAQWNQNMNGDITPDMVVPGSGKKVWWLLPYDDPKTGRHFNFEWQAEIRCRTIRGDGCPYLCGKAVWPGFNDLATTHPNLVSEWHPTRNGDLTPEQISANSNKLVWWILPYDDPKTGRHHDFEWPAKVINRAKKGNGCPYLCNKAAWPGFNDLTTTHPTLATEWHPTKNGVCTPDQVTAGSGKSVWWFLPYDDPKTGQHHDFEWEETVFNRARNGYKCPYLTGKAAWKGFNDLATTHPNLVSEWHPTRNGDLTPEQVTAGSEITAWWILPYDDPKTGHHDFIWPAKIESRALDNSGCPYLSGQAVWPGFNDLATTHPNLVSEWHPTRNGDLTPEQVTECSNKPVWWILPYDDPKTGQHHDFEWKAVISNRTRKGYGCPYLSGHGTWPGFNDLATTHPNLVSEWHPIKNGTLTPKQVSSGSKVSVWWIFPYDDPKTGHHDFEWKETVYNRAQNGYKCPYLTGKAAWKGFNDLATTHPNLVSEWHPTRNGSCTPDQVTAGSGKSVWWILPYDDPKTGQHHDFEWEETVFNRARNGYKCPYLTGKAAWKGFNDLATTHPNLVSEWHPTRNGSCTPDQVTAGSNELAWWIFPYDDPKTGAHHDFEWPAIIESRALDGCGCPFLSGQAVWPGFNDLATLEPEIATEFSLEKNHGITPNRIHVGSPLKYWWKCRVCGKEWRASVVNRTKNGSGCPWSLKHNIII